MLKTALFYYCLILTVFITLGAASNFKTLSFLPLLFFLPVTLYFFVTLFKRLRFKYLYLPLLYYSFIVVTIMSLVGLLGATTIAQLVSALIFLPMVLYFTLKVLPKKSKALNIPIIVPNHNKPIQPEKAKLTPLPKKRVGIDLDRRHFLKLIGSAGLTLFLFSIFTKKAQAAFFGSMPGPGTISIKDSGGTVIDPAVKQPTDGYRINQIDDSSPAYYGFVNKDGNWFIMKEDSSGNYRYSKGGSSFSTNWTNRASLTYDYFDAIF